ncbi:MAG TPA: ATP-binding protein [Waddliaceae bacterium]
MTAPPSNKIDVAAPAKGSSSVEHPPEQKKWCGRSICGIDTFSWLFGIALIATGVVLFVLNSFHTYDFFLAGTTTSGLGGGVFFLGLITHCCLSDRCCTSPQTEEPAKKTALQPATTVPKIPPPLPMDIETRAFFESKGIFGLPQSLIDELTIWRKYRTTENVNLIFGAGFILYGPPGTGKTTIAVHIAELLGGEYSEQQCESLLGPYVGVTGKNITDLFNVPENAFRVIVIDEISGLLSARSVGRPESNHHDRTLNHFLGVVSGRGATAPKYILIGTTNEIDKLDDAVVREGRLGKKFEITNPDAIARSQIFTHHLNKLALSKDEDWGNFPATLSAATDQLSCASIVGIVQNAQRKGILASRDLLQQDFIDVLAEMD